MLCTNVLSRSIFDFVLRIFIFFFAPHFSFWILKFSKKNNFGDLPLSHIPPKNTTSSSSTTSTSSIPSTNTRSTDLHPHIYSRLWQIITAASGTKAESICLITTYLSFRVQQKIGPLLKCNRKSFFFF